MPRFSDCQRSLRFFQLELNIALQSSSSEDSLDSADSDTSLDSGLMLTDSNSDLEDESSLDSDDGGAWAGSWDVEANLAELLELFFVMEYTRYDVERLVIAKSKEFARDFFANLPDCLFHQLSRMDKWSFFHLVELIEAHPVFHNCSFHFQAHVECQLAMTLNRLGRDGNGACLDHMIPTWGVSNGSIVSFTQ